MEYVIETKDLVKRYKNKLAINKINMQLITRIKTK